VPYPNAIAVDPQGETTWDVTEYLTTLDPAFVAETIERGSDHDDLLRQDPNAPEWVREWSGPFDTYIDTKEDA